MEDFSNSIISIEKSKSIETIPITENDIVICLICLNNTQVHKLDLCLHTFCVSCLVSFLELKISEFQVNDLQCPKCPEKILEEFAESIISDKSFKKYKDFQRIKQLELDIYVKFCPVADCKGFDIANDTNTKLTCNECAHKYCYYCSQKWHEGKCKDKTELSFKIWAYLNSLKICPRCKNYVQKYGGCPSMTCPRCQFQWCWICGKSGLTGFHDDVKCVIGRSLLDIYWYNIILLILLPILLPVLFPLLTFFYFLLFHYYEDDFLSNIHNKLWTRLIFYFLLLLLSPFLEILFVLGAFFFIVYSTLDFFRPCLYRAKAKIYKFFLFLFCSILGIILAGISIVAGILIISITPAFGLFFLLMKFYFICKNHNQKHPARINYRRSLV